jgi:hypothetical protein
MAGCTSAECHSTNVLVAEHQHWRPDFTCLSCHGSGDSNVVAAINAGKTGCGDCHTGVLHASSHTEDTPAECGACHTADVLTTHKSTCPTCHDNPARGGDLTAGLTDTNCLACHPSKTPVATNHFPAALHVSTDTPGCDACHQRDVLAEHRAAGFPAGQECVTCHTSDLFAGMSRPWNGSCLGCHVTNHAGAAARHDATGSASCSGAKCHAVTDVSAIHSEPGCGTCHALGYTPAGPDCTNCHSASLADGVHGQPRLFVGRVLDAATSRPLAYASVTLDGGKRVTTDRRGYFKFANPAAGGHWIAASARGYRSSQVRAAMRVGGQVIVNVRLGKVLSFRATRLR